MYVVINSDLHSFIPCIEQFWHKRIFSVLLAVQKICLICNVAHKISAVKKQYMEVKVQPIRQDVQRFNLRYLTTVSNHIK